MPYITQRQEDILLGSILGDGCVSIRKNAINCWYYLKQSPRYEDYVFWMYNELKNLCPSRPKRRSDNGQWYFYTSTIQELNWFRDVFYPEGKKLIPKDISRLLLSPLSLAIWYMDDGTLDYRPKYHCSFSLSTHCFTLSDAGTLADTLKTNFGVEVSINNNLIRGVRYPRIYIGNKGRRQFYDLVKPYMLDCFKYKLPPEHTL